MVIEGDKLRSGKHLLNPPIKNPQLQILLLEDSRPDILIFKNNLAASGLNVGTLVDVSSIREAVQLSTKNSFDLIFLDLELSDSNGIATFHEISTAYAGVPVIILSAHRDKDIITDCLRNGAQDYLVKGEYNAYLLERSVRFAIDRKYASEELRQSRRTYQILFEKNPLPSLAYRPDTLEIVMVNTAAVEQYGYSEEEFLRMTLRDLRPEEDLARFDNAVKNMPYFDSDGEQWRHKRKDGSIVEVEIQSQLVMLNNEQLRLVVLRDITDYKKSQQLLEENRNRLQLAIEAGRMAIIDVNFLTNHVRLSEGIVDIVGVPAERINDIDIAMTLVHEEDRSKVLRTIERERSGIQEDIQYRLIRPDNGKTVWVERRTIISFNAEGKAIESRGVVVDITALKNAQNYLVESFKDLEEAATRQASILNSLPAHIALLDHDGVVLSVNDSWKKFLEQNGRTSHELEGQSYFSEVHCEPVTEEIRRGILDVIAGKRKFFEHEYRCNFSYDERWFRLVVTPLETRERFGAVVMHIDITDRKLAERELASSQANLMSIFETTEDGYILVDHDHNIVSINSRAANEFLFKESAEVVGENLFNQLPEGRHLSVREALLEAKQCKTANYEMIYHADDGSTKYFHVIVSPVKGIDKVIIGYAICCHDITEHKGIEAALRASEERFRSVIENSGDLFTITDEQGRITYHSPNFEKILRYGPGELVGTLYLDLIHPDDVSYLTFITQQVARKKNELFHQASRIRLKDGNYIWTEGTMINLSDIPSVGGVVSNFRDISEKVRTETELNQSRYVLEKANEVAKIGYWIADFDDAGTKITWSKQMYAMYGVDESNSEVTTGEYFKTLVHPEDRESLFEAIQLAKRGEKEFNKDHRLIRPDGKVIWIHQQAEVFRDENGRPLSIIGVAQDITERKENENKIRAGKNNLDALINNTSDILWSYDANLRLVSANKAFRERIFNRYGFEPKEGDSVHFANNSDVSFWIENYKKVLKGHRLSFEISSGEGGNFAYMDTTLNPIFDGTRVVGISASTRDVTEKKKQERALTETNKRFEILSMATNDAVWDWGIEDNVIHWNHGLKTIYGHEPEGRKTSIDWWKEHIHPEDRQYVTESVNAAMRRKSQLWSCAYRFACADGTYRHSHDRGFIIYENDEAVRMIGAQQDVHELTQYRMLLEQKVYERTRELHQALEKEKELSEMKNRFVSIASHEFRTPLSTIQFAADFLKLYRNRLSDEAFEKKLSSISGQIQHMMHLLDDVLTVGKADSGKINVSKAPVDIKTFLDDLISNVTHASMSSHTINTIYELSDSIFESDEKLLNNIFSNLLSNAIKFSPEEQDVHLKCVQQGDDYIIEVCDNGIGVAESEAEHIFEPFSRGSNVGAISGTGLGLSIVKTAVTLLNGSLTLTRSDEFKTIFRVRLPRH